MQTRKVQKTGKSTLIISLPKPWTKRVGIEVGDSIGLMPVSNGKILLHPIKSNSDSKIETNFTIKDESGDYNDIKRKIIGSYLIGFDTTEVYLSGKNTKETKNKIRELRRSMIGLEVIEENDDYIKIKDYLDSSVFSMKKGIKRMHSISTMMFLDALRSLSELDHRLAEDVISRDDEVDKIYWMIRKQYIKITDDVYFAEQIETTPRRAVGYLLAAKSFERIADHGAKIAKNVKKMESQTEFSDHLDEIKEDVVDVIDLSFKSIHREKIDLADEALDRSNQVEEKIKSLKEEIINIDINNRSVISLAYIVDSIYRILSYSEDIAENSIDHNISLKYEKDNDF